MSGLQRRARGAAVVAGVAALAALTAGCSASSAGSRGAAHWREGATVESVAKTLQVPLPPTATDAKAAYLEGFQEDSLILAFVLPTDEVDAFVAQLRPEQPLRLREQPLAGNTHATAPFSHLGLPEPDLLPNVRESQVCAPCKDDLDWLKVAVARVDDRSSRVYLDGVD